MSEKPINHARDHRPGGTDTHGGGFIAYDVENIDPEGADGSLKIDTGLIEIGDTIPADWEVTAIDYQWTSTGGSGFDFECQGGNFQINVLKDGGGAHGILTLSAEESITIESNTVLIQLSANGIQMSGLPTTNPGGSGLLWNNGGVLNIT